MNNNNLKQDLLNENGNNEGNSFISERFDSISSINRSKAIIIENMNGTYSHGFMVRRIAEEENAKDQERNNGPRHPRNRILYVVEEDEIALYQSIYRLPTTIDGFVDLTLQHRKYFAFYLLSFLFLETIFEILTYVHKEEAEEEVIEYLFIHKTLQLMKGYKGSDQSFYDNLYFSGIVCELIYMMIYYPLGFIATWRKSIRLYSWFSLVSMAGLLFQMLLAFINKYGVNIIDKLLVRLNIPIFLLRFGAFGYSRFINQLLASLLLLPR